MADLGDFQVVDDVTDNLAEYHNRLLGGTIRAEFVNTETITTTKELTDNDCPFQVITAGTTDQTVELAPEGTGNHFTFVYNSGTNNVIVKDDSGATSYITLATDDFEIFYPVYGEGWKRKPHDFVGKTSAPTTDDNSGDGYQAADRWYTSNAVYVCEDAAAGTWEQIDGGAAGLPSGHIYGLEMSNNAGDATNDIDISAGECRDSTDAVDMTLTALTKRLDADWAAGTNQGMRNSAAAITDTTYHIYAVSKAAGADPDIYAHTSTTVATVITALQAETGGADYIYARRIGSIVRASGAIVGFSQNGNEFLLKAVTQVTATNPGTAAVLNTLTNVPVGIKVNAICTVNLSDGSPTGATYMLVTSPDQTDAAAAVTNFTLFTSASVTAAFTYNNWRTNTSAQIRTRIDSSTADHTQRINIHGWVDTRGQ